MKKMLRYTQSISSCDKAPATMSSGAYKLISSLRIELATQSQLERRRVYMRKMLRYMAVLSLLILMSGPLHAKKMDNLTVIVSSCDKYAELWHPFFTLLFKYWPTIEQPIYLISNQKTYHDPRVIPVMIENEKSWSDNLLVALEKTDDDYVMLILDDFFITSQVNSQKIEQYFELLKKEKAACVQLYKIPAFNTIHPEVKELGYLARDAKYRTSLQVAIWDKAILKELLISGEKPWEFELEGTDRSKEIERPFLGLIEGDLPISYLGAMFRGSWDPNAIAFLEKENIEVDFQLPVCGKIRKFVIEPLRTFISIHFLQPIKEYFGIKNILPVDV